MDFIVQDKDSAKTIGFSATGELELSYSNALYKVLKIREERRKIYGDSWKNSSDEELFFMIKQKFGRLEHIHNNKLSHDYEKLEDTLIDIINYSLFMLANHEKVK